MIGGGLALNDTGFILVQTTCPTSSLSQSVTLFLSLGAQSLQWGYKWKGERWGVQEVRSDSSQRDRERWELHYMLSVRACARGLNLVVLLLWTSELIDPNESVGKVRIPFYRWRGWPYKWEGESTYATKPCCPHRRVQDDGVGAHNTVGCQMHMGGSVVLFGYGRCRYQHTLLMPRGMWRVSPCALGTVNPGAHNTVDA